MVKSRPNNYNLWDMTSRIFSFEGHPARLQLASRPPDNQLRVRGHTTGWLILVMLSTVYAAWLIYRWLMQPAWPAALPSALAEMLRLFELATGLTLLVLWAGLLWRRRARRSAAAAAALTVSEMYALSPKAFEHYVASLFRRKGYKVVVRGRSGDHGVDLDLTAPDGRRAIVQCKRYRDTVGEAFVRGLFGTLLHETAHHAFLVTTADISEAARRWAAGKPMTLIDGPTLVAIATAIDESPASN
ncbi:MAG: restriction endonuclease [Chloroflexota bacterium]